MMPKNIIICCDGTGNQYGKNNTNVVKLFEKLVSGDDQKIFYDPGVGTASKALLVPFQKISTLFSQAFGLDLQRNVEDAYLYLMNTYAPGDQIFLFGFSRGAHTVRRLATMLENVELLHRGSENMIGYASRMYLNREKVGEDVLEGFRKAFCRPCQVHFIGVFDTVSAVSRLIPRPKLDGVFSSEVKFAYHAVAIDERRYNFPPNLWDPSTIAPSQIVEEVWFTGVHSDVGGSYQEEGLSNISLKWILEKAHSAGLKLRPGSLEKIKTNPLAPKHESWVGHWWTVPFPMYVGLAILALYLVSWIAWIFQAHLPETFLQIQNSVEFFESHWIWFLGLALLLVPFTQKKRVIPAGALVHSSVRERMDKSSDRPKNLEIVLASIRWVD